MSAATRRGLLGCTGLAAVALALPAAAGMLDDAPLVDGLIDPHIAWWADHTEVVARIAILDEGEGDDAAVDPLFTRDCDLLEQIVNTAPTTLEGLAIVAAATLFWYDDGEEALFREFDAHGGATMARYILATTTPDVLRRAGVERVA